MNILDDTKRALSAAKPLLKLLCDSTPASFEQDLESYAQADGILSKDFLEQVDKAKTLLPDLGDPEKLDPVLESPLEFQVAFVQYMFDHRMFDSVYALRDMSKDKRLTKHIKKTLHEMKTCGEDVPSPKKRKAGFKFAPVVDPAPLSLVAETNSAGEREIFYIAKGLRSGMRIFYVVSNFADGVIDFKYFETSKSGLRDMLKSMRRDNALEVFEVNQEHAYYFIEQAKSVNALSARPFPKQFMMVLQEFPKPESQVQEPPVRKLILDSEVESGFSDLVNTGTLHESIEFRTWMLPRDVLKKFETPYQEIVTSTVLVDQAQKQQQIQQLMQETVDNYFTPEIRSLWIRRIEDSAFLLAHSDRKRSALLAMIVAKALSQNERTAWSIPFCEKLLTKLIKPLPPIEPPVDAPPDESGGGIILP
jgi:hypothetical protein